MSYTTVPPQTGGGITLNQGTLAGRGGASGTGAEEEITLGTNLSFSGTTLNANAGSGAPSGAQYVTLLADAGLSAERVLTGSARVSVTDGGANNPVTLDIPNNGVGNAQLRQGAARSLIGVTGNATANVADIAGGGAGTYPKDSGSALAFGPVNDVIQDFARSGDLSPAQITADQNDYNPASLASASVLRLSTDASRNLTGLAGGADGRCIEIFNVGSFNLVLASESASSAAANRFSLFATRILGAGQSISLWYDSTSSRWRQQDFCAITDAEVASANKDGAAGTPSMRTIGTGATQACAGNDSRLSDTRTPTDGTVTTAKIVDANVTDAKLANMGARTLKGRSANSSGVPADIAGGGAGTYASDDGSTLAFRAVTDLIQNIAFSGDLSPAQITANQNDYNPASLSTASVLRINSDAARTLTGLAGGADGRFVGVINTGSFPITLSNQDTGSTAGNRFLFGPSLVLQPNSALILWYDSTTSRWRRFAAAGVAEAVFALTDGATITPNRDNGKHQSVTLAGNRTLAAPTGSFVDGDFLIVSVTQDGTGSRTLTHDTGTGAFEQTTTNTFPTLSTGASKTDELLYMYRASANKWRLMAVTLSA